MIVASSPFEVTGEADLDRVWECIKGLFFCCHLRCLASCSASSALSCS